MNGIEEYIKSLGKKNLDVINVKTNKIYNLLNENKATIEKLLIVKEEAFVRIFKNVLAMIERTDENAIKLKNRYCATLTYIYKDICKLNVATGLRGFEFTHSSDFIRFEEQYKDFIEALLIEFPNVEVLNKIEFIRILIKGMNQKEIMDLLKVVLDEKELNIEKRE